MENRHDTRTGIMVGYQCLVEPIGEYAGILLSVAGVVDDFDLLKIVAGGVIYAGIKGVSRSMQNRVDYDRFKRLENK